ncbi:YegP family protein [Hellea sp.]|nr:YegP family protein [Hellea sp.]
MADKNLDDYKSLKFYQDNSKARENGFAKFEVDDEHYFALYKDGDIALLSQAYVNISGRDNGIESVRKNSKVKMRYHFDTRAGGKHGFGLKAGNGQEIGVSPNYGSKAKADYVAGRLNGSVKKKIATPPKTQTSTADGRIENYHPLAFYKQHGGGGVRDGFDSFSQDGAHYFTYNQNGKIVLISESYTSKAGRDNGIASVTKNLPLKTRYQHHIHKNGKHYFDLNAGNGQEIATSIWYGSAAASLAGANALRGEKTKSPRKASVEDDYRPLAFYNKHTKGRKKGIEKFKGDDGEYYFAYFENGKIRLISEGYPTVAARDTGVASVEKNIKLANRYDYRGPFKNGKYDYRLKAGNGKEIARSVWYGSAAAAATGAAYLMGTRKRPAAKPKAAKPVVAAVPKPKAKPKAAPIAAVAATAAAASAVPAMAKAATPAAPRDKDDDYLKCEEYHGHKVTDEKNNVAFFSHSNNKEYFVVYGEDDTVLIRSEGFDSISKRSSELAAVLRLKDNPKNFTRMEKGGYFVDILKDENGREVGRSCVRKIVPIVAAAPVAATPIAAALPAAAATGGFSWGWLKWLLPLLLLLLLAFFGLKACGGDKAKIEAEASAAAAAERVAAAKAETARLLAIEKAAQAEKVAAERAAARLAAEEKAAAEAAALAEVEAATPPPAPKPVTPKAVTANMSRVCGASDRSVFNVPSFATPVNVTRLGTYPQFGDSHTLSPSEFYDKLANRYAVNNYDRQYLDYLAKSLGYANGFKGVSASDFSNDTLQKGAKGLLGYGEFHGLAYSQLNVSSPRDQEAFRLRAANGMDVHFMKSCGNYMYVCQ